MGGVFNNMVNGVGMQFAERLGKKEEVMYDRMPNITSEKLTMIHDASMDILDKVGVVFNEAESIEIFKKNGLRVDGKRVFFKEADITKAVELALSRFLLKARNPDKHVYVGEDDFVFVPGYGAPFVITSNGRQRNATMEDYDNFCKLVQTSPHIDMNGFMMVEPSDIPPNTAHLDMMLSSIVLCDGPFMGSPISRQGVKDCIEMLAIMCGGKEQIKESPRTVSLINSLSPLQFSEEMASSLIELVRNGQACIVASLVMAGASGPIQLAGVMAMQNAEILAGLSLAQTIRPGTPIIYGSASAPMDMMTGSLSIGAPELSMLVSGAAQMARFYKLPSRSGGALTDANIPDAQAGVQSALALLTAARSGINFILHACGILNAYLAMSYEKFLIDEEYCGMLRRLLHPIEVTHDSIDTDMIREVGCGGSYLTQLKTVERCRTEYFRPEIMKVETHGEWFRAGGKRSDEAATDLLNRRLANYEKPDIEPEMESALSEYVTQRKNG